MIGSKSRVNRLGDAYVDAYEFGRQYHTYMDRCTPLWDAWESGLITEDEYRSGVEDAISMAREAIGLRPVTFSWLSSYAGLQHQWPVLVVVE